MIRYRRDGFASKRYVQTAFGLRRALRRDTPPFTVARRGGDAVAQPYSRVNRAARAAMRIARKGPVGEVAVIIDSSGQTHKVRKVETVPPVIDTAGTDPIDRVYTETVARFDGIENWGICNCRRISGSLTFSQHAWCNAWDIHHDAMGTMDAIAAFLEANRDRLQIAHVLWRIADHFDHVHVDCYPQGEGIPPCAR